MRVKHSSLNNSNINALFGLLDYQIDYFGPTFVMKIQNYPFVKFLRYKSQRYQCKIFKSAEEIFYSKENKIFDLKIISKFILNYKHLCLSNERFLLKVYIDRCSQYCHYPYLNPI